MEEVLKAGNPFTAKFQPDREAISVAGEVVFVAELSAEEAMGLSEGDQGDYVYRLLARAIVNKDGSRIFGDSKEEVAQIKRMGQRKLRPLIRAAIRMNGLDEEPEKNSDAGPTAG